MTSSIDFDGKMNIVVDFYLFLCILIVGLLG